jgi:hypothetical protein
VPVLAAALADVLVRDPHPLVLLGLEQHLLDPAAVLLLDVGAVPERLAGVVEALCEVVSELLELREGEQARSAARAHPPVEARAREGRAEEGRELRFEAGDLLEQRAPGRALVGARARQDRRQRRRGSARGANEDVWHGSPSWVESVNASTGLGANQPFSGPVRTSLTVQIASSRLISGTPLT